MKSICAVVALIKDGSAASEDWSWFNDEINTACKKAGNYFADVDQAHPRAVIGGTDTPVEVMDMGNHIKQHANCNNNN